MTATLAFVTSKLGSVNAETRSIASELFFVARSAGHADEGSEEESTEDLRQAIRKYRAVYQRLVRE